MRERGHINKLVIDGTAIGYYTFGKWRCRVFEVEACLKYDGCPGIEWVEVRKYILKRAKELNDCRISIVEVPDKVSNWQAKKTKKQFVTVKLAFKTEEAEDLRNHSDIDQWIIRLRDDIASRYGLRCFS